MVKYKNNDGVELNYTGGDSHQVLVREVVREACKIINMYDRSCKISMGMAIMNCKKFLRVNFDLDSESNRSDAWRINEFNRNRAPQDQVDSIEEMEKQVKDMFDE